MHVVYIYIYVGDGEVTLRSFFSVIFPPLCFLFYLGFDPFGGHGD